MLWLCKRILKASGKRGLPQGSVIGPLWANVFLDDVDRMLEQAQSATQQGIYEVVRYTRFADDLVVLVSSHPSASHWAPRVERRLREELGKLDLTINEEKSRIVDSGTGESFDFLGYTFRWADSEKTPGKMVDHVERGRHLRHVEAFPRLPCAAAQRAQAATRIGPLTDSTGNAGWRKSPCPV